MISNIILWAHHLSLLFGLFFRWFFRGLCRGRSACFCIVFVTFILSSSAASTHRGIAKHQVAKHGVTKLTYFPDLILTVALLTWSLVEVVLVLTLIYFAFILVFAALWLPL